MGLSATGHAITESKVLTDHLSPAQIEVLHVPDVDILDYKFYNSNASVGCASPNCDGSCNTWFCWPCVQYDEEYMFQESGADWNCPSCTRDCDIIY